MSFFLSPFRFLFELIAFAIQAAFVYGLLLIFSVTVIWYSISKIPKEPEVIVKTVIEKHEVTRFLEKEPSLICERITGCELFPNAKTEKEYCPTCIVK
tara:strand:+ start:501 stop:794 length:294 start_codon:yes stop_codon:yes gene_type:complete